MKRLLALLLAALILALPALALDYTLEEKLFKQVKDGSGFKLRLEFEKKGGAFGLLSDAQNALVAALLNGSQLQLHSLRGVGTIKGRQDVELALTRDGQGLMDLRFLRNAQHQSLSSSLFGGATYADLRDGGGLMALLLGEQPPWPPVEGMLLRFASAESTWQTEANKKLEEYSLKLSVFLANYTTTQQIRDAANQTLTQVKVQVPAGELKEQIKRLLGLMYQDQALLALLSREMTARESTAFLQPEMLAGFSAALDAFPMRGEVLSQRLINAQGQVVDNRLTLPLDGARGLDQVVYEQTLEDGKSKTFLSLFFRSRQPDAKRGAVLELQWTAQAVPGSPGSTSYSGKWGFAHDPADQADHLSGRLAGGPLPLEGTFQLQAVLAPEVEDPTNDSSTRHLEFSLRVTPEGELAQAISPQTLRLTLDLSGRQRTAAATYLTGSLAWQDEGTDALLNVQLEGNSAAPWSIPEPLSDQAVLLHNLGPEEIAKLRTQVMQTMQAVLASKLLSQPPAQTAAPAPSLPPSDSP